MERFFNDNSEGSILEGFRYFIKSVVKECMEETLDERMNKQTYLNQTITREDLCKRWGCCKNTIRNKELEGILNPLNVNGKKKVYSMREVLDIENSGELKWVC